MRPHKRKKDGHERRTAKAFFPFVSVKSVFVVSHKLFYSLASTVVNAEFQPYTAAVRAYDGARRAFAACSNA